MSDAFHRVDARIADTDAPHTRASATLHLEGAVKQAADTCRTRMVMLAVAFTACFIIIAGRLVDVMVFQAGNDTTLARRTLSAPLGRADIVDRNGVLLATDLPTQSLYAEPRRVLDPAAAARKLVSVLPDLNQADLVAKLSTKRGFVWIKRGLTPRQQADVHALGIPGLAFMREERRVYPQGELTSHVVGFTDIDRHGLAGVEEEFNKELQSRAAADQPPLQLSIDVRFQEIVREAVLDTVRKFKARGGVGIVMNANTGEVLAMVSLPDFDSNRPGAATPQELFNRATLGVYEMGSIFKVFTVAMALQDHVVTLASGFDASHPLHVGGFTIHDDHAQNRWLSVPEILIYSSNIGAAKMALDVGTKRQEAFMRRIGMLSKSPIQMPARGEPIYPSPWRDINTMTIGFGHGLAVTPIQAVTAMAAMVNGGVLHKPTLLKWTQPTPPPGIRVIDPDVSAKVRTLLRLVVLYGTGEYAKAPGYMVGGKTGTAEQLDAKGGYATHKLISSFLAAFPIDHPRYVILVSIDEPHGIPSTYGYATGGWTAAPAVAQIVSRIGPLAGIVPSDARMPGLPPPQGTRHQQLEAILASFATH